MTFDSLIRALGARRSGSTAWMARCPAHKDRNPSLAIRETDGKILLYCHAGCKQQDVIAQLRSRGLWYDSPADQVYGGMRTSRCNDLPHQSRRIVATYDYQDLNGELLYQIVRWEPKSFSQRRPDGLGGWIWKKGKRQVLYRLREVLEAPVVFIVEGEKDVETLRAHGFVATTNAGGANALWLPAYTEPLAGREVILIPDNDAPGRNRVLSIARALLGHAAKLTILTLEDAPEAKDVTDWFNAGRSELDLIAQLDSEGLAP